MARAQGGPETLSVSMPIAQLHDEDRAGQGEGDDVGNDHGPGLEHEAIGQPQGDAYREEAVHRQGNARHIACAKGFEGLGDEADRCQEGGHIADEISPIHDLLSI
jgi:hypothetical protein